MDRYLAISIDAREISTLLSNLLLRVWVCDGWQEMRAIGKDARVALHSFIRPLATPHHTTQQPRSSSTISRHLLATPCVGLLLIVLQRSTYRSRCCHRFRESVWRGGTVELRVVHSSNPAPHSFLARSHGVVTFAPRRGPAPDRRYHPGGCRDQRAAVQCHPPLASVVHHDADLVVGLESALVYVPPSRRVHRGSHMHSLDVPIYANAAASTPPGALPPILQYDSEPRRLVPVYIIVIFLLLLLGNAICT